MRMLVLILAACALAAQAPAAAAAPGDSARPAQSGGDRDRRRALTPADTYVSLPPLTASVQSDFRLRGVLHIEAGLDIPDARLRERARTLMPRLRNAYVSALAVYAGSNYRFGDVPDAERIAYLLQDATDEVLGEGASVLLGMVIVHAN
ncbi:MAG: hypothetical protein KIS81_05385 [Maricaulaceae bacterium]|nr:hypothetical protein [Maricaulaceae bacterium]